MKKRLSLKISISGVRGVIGDSLTPQLAARFAASFGTYLGRGRVAVGRDGRPSGPMLINAIHSGLLAVGCQPVDIGICPIPSVLLYAKESRAAGAIAVTASHNPKEWNGLKFISRRGLFLNASEVDEFLDIYHHGEFSFVGVERYRAVGKDEDPTAAHLEKLLRNLDVGLIRTKKFRVVADCSNGAGSVLLPKFLEKLGCEVILLNAVADGSFARQSEPVAENLGDLCRLVKAKKADIGFAQDADADRLAVINEKGEPLGEELTLALAVKHVLGRTPGPVVTNLSATMALEDIAGRAGVPVFRTKIGEINVVEEILNKNAVIGGEGNGGVIWPKIHPCRDSFAGVGLILEAMALSGKRISALRKEIPAYAMIKDKIQGSSEQAHRMLNRLKKKYAGEKPVTLDGLKIQFGNAWIHIRPSNTEPIIRVIAEAKSAEQAGGLLERFKLEIRALLK